jgi:FkbM family methyltransferase
MYSQNNEEQIILKYLGDSTGTFLDIGAYDGITFSNTYELVKRGWKGVMVEASPRTFIKLQTNVEEFKNNLTLVNACIVTDAEKLVDFYDNIQATATHNLPNVEKWKKETPFDMIAVMTCHHKTLLEKVGHMYDFVNIDVEGSSTDLFMCLYDELPDVKIWCVEHDGNDKEIIEKAKGCKVLLRNGENLILAK